MQDRLAMNFLMDRSAALWAKDLAALKDQLGACPTAEPPVARGALGAMFRLNCELAGSTVGSAGLRRIR